MPDSNDSIRLSNSDRDQAVAALGKSLGEGRLTTEEFEQRSSAAKAATTRGDLKPLFADLPDSTLADAAFGASASPAAASAPPREAPRSDAYDDDYRRDDGRTAPLGGRTGVAIVSIAPLIAVVLFFLTGWAFPHGWNFSWLWFVLIPIAGGIVYGFGGYRDRDRYRNRDGR